MAVTTQTATVFHGGRRRWFSLAAACRAEASSIANRFCNCERGDAVTPPMDCRLHGNPARRERLVNWLAARVRRQRQIEPVAASAIEQRALAACRELVAATAEVSRLSRVIGENLGACPLITDPIEYGPKGPVTHLSMAYAAEEIEDDSEWGGTHKEWNSQHLLNDCPHCMAAHLAVQERKQARQRLGKAKRAVTILGKSL